MELTTTAQVSEALRALPRSEWDAIARASGVPRSTIEKIAYGVTENPGFDSTTAVARALNDHARRAVRTERAA